MASANKTNRVALGGIGLGVIVLLLWTYCGGVDQGGPPAVTQAPEPDVQELEALPREAPALAPVAVVAPVAEPAIEAVVEEPGNEVPVIPVPVVVVAEAVIPVAEPAVPVEKPVVRRSPEPPPVSAPPVAEPVPQQDLLIAKASAKRFTPDVAALASSGLSVGVPIQGDENSLNVLQPCDTPASGCGAGAGPSQVVGGANDWTGFVLPGF